MPRPSPKRTKPASPERARRRVLAEWRRVDLTEVEGARKVSGRAVGDVLPGVLQELHLEKKLAESRIVIIWSHAIDPVITAHAQPAGLHKGTLFVNVDSNVWLTEIVRYRRREILERIQHALGSETVQRISFRLG